jgi:hypothetical protein
MVKHVCFVQKLSYVEEKIETEMKNQQQIEEQIETGMKNKKINNNNR